MTTKFRMSPARKHIISKLETGAKIIADKDPDRETQYAFSDGEQVSQDVVRRLFKHGVFQPCGDGLFGDSQSFQLAEGFSCGA